MRRMSFLSAMRSAAGLAAGALLAAACLPSGVQLPQSSLLSALERQSGKIAVLGTDGNLFVTDQAARDIAHLTDDASPVPDEDGAIVRYDAPTWSPVGRRLAYLRTSAVQGGRIDSSVFVTGEEGDDPVEVFHSTRDIPFYLYWSPDARWVSFLTTGVGAGGPLALRLVSADGGEVRVIDTGAPYYWAWSPSSPSIVAHANGSAQATGEARLSLLDLGETVMETSLGRPPGVFQTPEFSPDGGSILFSAHLEGGGDGLILADGRGRQQSVVAEVPGAVAFAWAPTGQTVAFVASPVAGQTLPGDLYFLDLDDPANPVSRRTDAANVAAFFWSPDSEQVAYLVPVVLSGSGEAVVPGQVPIDQILLQLSVVEAETGAARRIGTFRPTNPFWGIIPFFDQYHRSATLWSPDGNYLVVSSAVGTNQEGIFLVSSSGNLGPRFLVDGTMAFWSRE
jgi:TolB protein